MRLQAKAAALAAVACAGAAIWAVTALHRASSALSEAGEATAEATRIDFQRGGWEPAGAVYQMLPARPDLCCAEWFGGSLWLAGRGGLLRYSPEGELVRMWQVGADLPPAPITALATGLDPRGEGPALFAATAGEGLLIVGEQGRVELLRAAGHEARDILSLLPLSDGRILLGTQQAGVLVYSGAGLTSLHQELSSGHVVALAGSPEEIWIATLDEGLMRFRAGAIERFDEQSGLPDRRVLSLSAMDGAAFAGTAVGVAEIEDGAFRRTLADGFFASALWASGDGLQVGTLEEGVAEIPLARARIAPPARVDAQGPQGVRRLVELDGDLYAVTREALWQRSGDGAWAKAIEPAGPLRDRNISALHADANGRLWVGYFDRGLDLLDGGVLSAQLENDVVYCVNRIVADPERDIVAVATANGLAFLDGAGRQKQTLRRDDGLMANHVTDIVFQPGGWVAATPAGLTFLDAGGMRGLYALHGLVNNHVYTLAARGRTLLAGTLGGLSSLEGGVVRKGYTTANSSLGHNWISALAAFRGDWFVGTYGAGVVKLADPDRLEAFEGMEGIEINPNALAASPERIYAGTLDRGLLVYAPEWDRWRTAAQGLSSANITALAYRDGTLYIGTDNGLARIAEKDLSLQ